MRCTWSGCATDVALNYYRALRERDRKPKVESGAAGLGGRRALFLHERTEGRAPILYAHPRDHRRANGESERRREPEAERGVVPPCAARAHRRREIVRER